MVFFLAVSLAVAVYTLGMLAACEVGRLVAIRSAKASPEGRPKASGPADVAIFGLLGLLIALTFSGAASRFEDRRHLIVEEANAIGTAYLRLDLMPVESRDRLRALFQDYVKVRHSVYSGARDQRVTAVNLARTSELQDAIWREAALVVTKEEQPSHVAMLVLPALNDMIDITSTRNAATRNHPPLVIFIMLSALSFVGVFLVGYGGSENGQRNWLQALLFSLVMSLTFYVIADLEFPRLGIIRITDADQMLLQLPERQRTTGAFPTRAFAP